MKERNGKNRGGIKQEELAEEKNRKEGNASILGQIFPKEPQEPLRK